MEAWASPTHTYLDQQFKVPSIVVAAGRGITPHDILPINLSLDRNVLSDRQAKHVIGAWQAKAVAAQREGRERTPLEKGKTELTLPYWETPPFLQ